MHHNLKILPAYFEAVAIGDKTFEIRDNTDRGFQKGDTVTLIEFDPERVSVSDGLMYTGAEIEKRITYVTNYGQQPGFVVFGLGDV
jgi:ASC-1-like (ASCH) protein